MSLSPAAIVTLSSLLTFGAPLALAVYEILSLRRSPRGGDDEPPPPEVPRVPKPLPDCLLPKPARVQSQVRGRVLEDA